MEEEIEEGMMKRRQKKRKVSKYKHQFLFFLSFSVGRTELECKHDREIRKNMKFNRTQHH